MFFPISFKYENGIRKSKFLDEFEGVFFIIPETTKSVLLSIERILPRGSSFPKYFSARFSVNIIE